jgi:hypothetical protein
MNFHNAMYNGPFSPRTASACDLVVLMELQCGVRKAHAGLWLHDEMLTFGVGSIAAAGQLPQRLFAALLCWQVGRGGGRLALAMLLFLAGRCRHAFHHPWMGVPDFYI